MNKLYEFVARSGLIIFLSDKSGLILESIGDGDVADNASKVNLVKGTGWKEEIVGTNGIGTALKIKKPIQSDIRQGVLLCQASCLDLLWRPYF